MIEIADANDLDLPDNVVTHPAIQNLEVIAHDVVSWSNELYSYDIEQAAGQDANLISVAQNPSSS
ncbi:hypothetical protein BOTBODRAFT_176290 [Botryobasidium botryosum FD-172 SS1]|uniref:Uncharacterized protein n=1 Tax=Botryobasidium botryosum (strain FD-172 SS1) TaxID=930990 RepID=A0A067ML41_BOTB1|nr:hypothetical protein BOTBODRAFT_176290 [Botryobasidium botryosum FD-172 SS1]